MPTELTTSNPAPPTDKSRITQVKLAVELDRSDLHNAESGRGPMFVHCTSLWRKIKEIDKGVAWSSIKLAEGMRVTAGTLIPHQPIRRIIAASDINQWIEEE